jgi:hypothetical protein
VSKATPEQDLSFIFNGVTVTTLAQIFGMDHKEVNKRLVGKVTPNTSGKYVKYKIKDAAPWLVDMKVDPEEYLKALSPSKLPPALQDAFWKAQLSRQKYEENKGDLWRTARVYEAITGAFKVVRLTILMFGDNISQQTELSDKQREILQMLTDGLLESLNTSLVESFKDYTPADDEHGKSLSGELSDPVSVDAGAIKAEDEDAEWE